MVIITFGVWITRKVLDKLNNVNDRGGQDSIILDSTDSNL